MSVISKSFVYVCFLLSGEQESYVPMSAFKRYFLNGLVDEFMSGSNAVIENQKDFGVDVDIC
jgi:hypothetical protein